MPNTTPLLSVRQGALALRGIERFINRVRTPHKSAQTTLKLINTRRMGENQMYKCSPKLMDRLRSNTLFSRTEVEALYKIFKKLVTFNNSSCRTVNDKVSTSMSIINPSTASEGINRTVFREVLHNTFDIVTENVLMDRIFCVWDRLNSGLITLDHWIQGMSMFLKSNVPKQIDYCFAVYDLNGDGFITKDEMFQLLRNCLIKFPQEEDPEESVKDLVDIVMRKMDVDKDGKVSLKDYQETVAAEPLLLEAFGRCLPSESSKVTFSATLML